MKAYSIVGKSVKNMNAMEKATGTATFSTDVALPGMLYGKVLRSPYAHAEIVSIDTSGAEKLPGVKAVATYQNTPRNLFNASASFLLTAPPYEPIADQYIFDSVVRYVGDEVAAVAAVSEKVAKEAMRLIKVEYEELPVMFDPLEANKPDATDIHSHCKAGKNIPGGITSFSEGDVAKGFEECDVIYEGTFKLPVQKQAQLETHAAVAQVSANGKITVWCTTQTPHPAALILAKALGTPQSKIRVLNPPYVGGGFGVRIGFSGKAEPIAAVLAMLAGKPVKVVYSRKEDFIASDTRHAGYITVKLGAKKDGAFHAMTLKTTLNAGAYGTFSGVAPGVGGSMGFAVYRIPNKFFKGCSVYTNTTPGGAMRGFGNPQVMFAIESAVDMVAEKLGMDPMELRLKNIMRVGDPWHLPYPCSSTGLAECIEKGARSIGWERRGGLNQPGAKKLRGIGLGVGTHVSCGFPFNMDYDNAIITVNQDGSVNLLCGVPDIGTGTTTTLPQIAAEALGVGLDQIGMVFGDSKGALFEVGSHGSRTFFAAGTAVLAAASEARKQILEYAGDFLKVPPESLNMKDSLIYAGREPEERKNVTLRELAYHAYLRNKRFTGVGRPLPGNTPPWEAHFAEVEVDTETGQVKVIKVAAAHDVGKAIHPAIAEGQIEGGVLMGVGYAVTEEIRYDARGKQLHDSLHKYMVPTAEDTPEIDAILVEERSDCGPFGAKGLGETGLVPTAGAIANAVYNATGVRFFEIPLTEERVYKALKERGLSPAGLSL